MLRSYTNNNSYTVVLYDKWGYPQTALAGETITYEVEDGVEDLPRLRVYFEEYDNGNSGPSKTIDWNNGQKQKVRLTANVVVLTFIDPPGVGNFILKCVQDGEGNRQITWPGVKCANKQNPVLSTSPGAVDIAALYYDGEGYNIMVSNEFAIP